MESFIVVLHIIVALILISLVLVQDSKGGGALGIGGSGSNSLLGATGAQSLAAKLTRFAAIIFAGTCLTLTWLASTHQKSVIDSLPAAATLPAPAQPAAPAAPATPEAAKAPAAGQTAPDATKDQTTK